MPKGSYSLEKRKGLFQKGHKPKHIHKGWTNSGSFTEGHKNLLLSQK